MSAQLQLWQTTKHRPEQWDTLCPGTRAPLLLCTLYCKSYNPFLLCTTDATSKLAHSGMETSRFAVVLHGMTSWMLLK
eukprot:16854-Heterococcus_DN1.PRE.2